ncbi:unnamed protein product, partial [Nesidiocoris tenuis]
MITSYGSNELRLLQLLFILNKNPKFNKQIVESIEVARAEICLDKPVLDSPGP